MHVNFSMLIVHNSLIKLYADSSNFAAPKYV